MPFIVRSTFVYPSHQHLLVKSGITARQMLKMLKKEQNLILIKKNFMKMFLEMGKLDF